MRANRDMDPSDESLGKRRMYAAPGTIIASGFWGRSEKSTRVSCRSIGAGLKGLLKASVGNKSSETKTE